MDILLKPLWFNSDQRGSRMRSGRLFLLRGGLSLRTSFFSQLDLPRLACMCLEIMNCWR